MMSDHESQDAPMAKVCRIADHHVLVLGDPSLVRVVVGGAAILYGSRIEGERPIGRRHYLFTLGKGDSIFPVVPEGHEAAFGLVLMGMEGLTLREVPSGEIFGGHHDTRAPFDEMVEGWVQRLSATFGGGNLPSAADEIADPAVLHCRAGQALRPKSGSIVWVQIEAGKAFLNGFPELAIGVGDVAIPLGADLWLEISEPTTLRVSHASGLGSEKRRLKGLDVLNSCLLKYIGLMESIADQSDAARFQSRYAGQQRMTGGALEKMGSVLMPSSQIPRAESALLNAVMLVGREMDIPIRSPANLESTDHRKDSLEAIAQASQFHTRRVMLRHEWWKSDCGVLLATMEEEARPVALLRVGNRGYEIVDPESGSRVPVNEQTSRLLLPEATALYRPLPHNLHAPWRLVGFSMKGKLKDVAFILGVSALVALLGMLTPQAMATAMDKAIPDADKRLLVELGMALVAIAFGMAMLGLAQGLTSVRLAVSSEMTAQAAVWDRLLKLRVSFFKPLASGELLERTMAVNSVTQEFNGAALTTLLTAVMALLNLGLMFYYSASLALAALVMGLVVGLVTVSSSHAVRKSNRIFVAIQSRLFGFVVQLASSANKIRIGGAQRYAFAIWANRYAEQLKWMNRGITLQDHLTLFNSAVATCGTILVFWLAVPLLLTSSESTTASLTVGNFLAFNIALGVFLRGATSISNRIVVILDAAAKGERIRPILESRPEADEFVVNPGRLSGRISLSHVGFRYSKDGRKILDDLSIEAWPGQSIGLVGPSGSGKSTIFRLLLGFEVPEVGVIAYDGRDLRGLDITAVRRQMGVVLQAARITAGSLLDNIAGGTSISLQEAWEAAEDTGLAQEIRQMPMGMHTVVNEGGNNLSGGQCQRIALSRALVKKPKILLLDEATSALDNRTQAIVSQSLNRRKVTRIVIAHRLSTICNADRIYVLDQGRVVQRGTFRELTEQGGLFATMMARQRA